MGNVSGYIRTVLTIFEQGYEHVKIVARGQAVDVCEEIVEVLKDKIPHCLFNVRFTKSLNKTGNLVDEMHALISQTEG